MCLISEIMKIPEPQQGSIAFHFGSPTDDKPSLIIHPLSVELTLELFPYISL